MLCVGPQRGVVWCGVAQALSPSGGDALVWGHSVRSQQGLKRARALAGVCPQASKQACMHLCPTLPAHLPAYLHARLPAWPSLPACLLPATPCLTYVMHACLHGCSLMCCGLA